nr:hypothetical protein [Planobispora rosea]
MREPGDVVAVGAERAAEGLPHGQGPPGGVVGVVRDRPGLLPDQLEVGDELVGRGRPVGDAGRLEDPLVVDEALGVAEGGDAVHLAVVGLLVDEAVLLAELLRAAQRLEEGRELAGRHRVGDEEDVAVLRGVHPDADFVLVVGDALELHLDARVELGEPLGVLLERGVHQVGPVRQDGDGAGGFGVCRLLGRRAVARAGGGGEKKTGGQQRESSAHIALLWSGGS